MATPSRRQLLQGVIGGILGWLGIRRLQAQDTPAFTPLPISTETVAPYTYSVPCIFADARGSRTTCTYDVVGCLIRVQDP